MSGQFGISDEAVGLHVSDDFSDVPGIVVEHRGCEQVEGSGAMILTLE